MTYASYISSGLRQAAQTRESRVLFHYEKRREAMEKPGEHAEQTHSLDPAYMRQHTYYQALQHHYQSMMHHRQTLMAHHESLMEHQYMVQALYEGLCCKKVDTLVNSASIREQKRSFLHEEPESVQMASFRSRDHSAVCPVVPALLSQLP